MAVIIKPNRKSHVRPKRKQASDQSCHLPLLANVAEKARIVDSLTAGLSTLVQFAQRKDLVSV